MKRILQASLAALLTAITFWGCVVPKTQYTITMTATPSAGGTRVADFFRNSTTWVIDFRYDGRPRQWLKVFREGLDPTQSVRQELQTLYGERVRLEQVRVATSDEESRYLRGEAEKNLYCPTSRRRPAD